jgi:hypothetical protein
MVSPWRQCRAPMFDGTAIHAAFDDELPRVGAHIDVWQINGDAAQDVTLQIRAEKLCGEFQPIK